MAKSAKQASLTSISRQEAAALAVTAQGLAASSFGSGRAGALKAIRHLGYVQIDTLAVASRSHHHVLWNRVPGYSEAMLGSLLNSGKIFEYWSHAASYLPLDDFRFTLPRKKTYAEGGSHWFAQDKKMKKYVLDRIRAEGALQSKDFEHKRSGPGNWYDWKPAKKALEQLFMEGELMVASRKNFQKVYDLTERVLPEGTDTSMPPEDEYARFLVQRSVAAHGLVLPDEVSYMKAPMRSAIKQCIIDLCHEGKIVPVRVDSAAEQVYYAAAGSVAIPKKQSPFLQILSPFDNLVIQRKRVQRLFNFDYVIECYLPEHKRKYGYFSLPVLYNNHLVARFDPKADRAASVFHVKVLHFEKGFVPGEEFNALFAAQLKAYAAFNSCAEVVIDNAGQKWKKEINRYL